MKEKSVPKTISLPSRPSSLRSTTNCSSTSSSSSSTSSHPTSPTSPTSPSHRPPLYPKKKVHFASCIESSCDERTCSTYSSYGTDSSSVSSHTSWATSSSSSSSLSSSFSFPLSSSKYAKRRIQHAIHKCKGVLDDDDEVLYHKKWEDRIRYAAHELSRGIHQIASATKKGRKRQQPQQQRGKKKTNAAVTVKEIKKQQWREQLLNLLGGTETDNDRKVFLRNQDNSSTEQQYSASNEREKKKDSSSPMDLLTEASFHHSFFVICIEHSIPSSLVESLRLLRALEIQQTYDERKKKNTNNDPQSSHDDTHQDVSITHIATDKVYLLWHILIRYYRKARQQQQQQQQQHHECEQQDKNLLFLQPTDLLTLLALSGISYPSSGIHVGQAVSLSIVSFAKYCLLSSHIEFLHDRKAIRHMMQDIKELLHSPPPRMVTTTTGTIDPLGSSTSSSMSTYRQKKNANSNPASHDDNSSDDMDIVYMNEKDSHSMRMIFRAVRTLVYLIRYSNEKRHNYHSKRKNAHKGQSTITIIPTASSKYNDKRTISQTTTVSILLHDFDSAGGYGLMRYIVENYSCRYENVDSTVVRHTWVKLENILLSCREKTEAAEEQAEEHNDSYRCTNAQLESIGEESRSA